MKILAFSLIAASALAQSSNVSNTTAVDINGNRVSDGSQVVRSKSGSGADTTERTQSINGRTVPLERTEERVIREDANGKVVERITKRYDQNGTLSGTVKQTIDQQTRSDGSTSVQTSTYRSDINGGMQLSEKSLTETRKSGSNETSETVIQRPTINGSVDTVEKRTKTVAGDPNAYREDMVISRRDGNGGFSVAVRTTTEHSQQGGQASDNTAEYEIGSNGQLQLHGQKVINTVTRADGSKESVVDVFGTNVPGTVGSSTSGLKLQEQQVIQTRVGAGDSTVETVTVRRPTVSEPNKLGPPRQISETTCKGKCTP